MRWTRMEIRETHIGFFVRKPKERDLEEDQDIEGSRRDSAGWYGLDWSGSG
jgi:hypothetical protein